MCNEWFTACDHPHRLLLAPSPPPTSLFCCRYTCISVASTSNSLIHLSVVCALVQVLILLPMRNMALKCILRLLQMTQKETRTDSIQGMRRLQEDFGPGEKHPFQDFAFLQKTKMLVCNSCPVC